MPNRVMPLQNGGEGHGRKCQSSIKKVSILCGNTGMLVCLTGCPQICSMHYRLYKDDSQIQLSGAKELAALDSGRLLA